jgi:hypothetical protein
MTFGQEYDDFERENFQFNGNYRAIVENNDDPEKAGRVQVRIFGLHSPFASETPTDHLPWAEPCLGLYWSGGHNIENNDTLSDRYRPSGSENDIPNKNVTKLTPASGVFIDPVEDDCGTGGFFTVPRKGTIVWVFFDSSNHNRPIYWGASPKQQDWEEQQRKLTQDVNSTINNVKSLRDKFTPDKNPHKGASPAQNALVQTYCSKPRANVYPIDDINQQDVTSFTSKNGTTFIVVNQNGKERYYLINKGTTTFVSEYGHRKTIVGTTSNAGSTINSNDEELVAGHKELHIVGDYDIFAQGNIFIQGEQHCQLNIKKNVGIVVKEGDVDLVIEKGHANIEVSSGNLNAHIGGNMQAKIDKDAIIKVDGNMDATVNKNFSATVMGDSSINSIGNTKVISNGNISLQSSAEIDMICSALKVTAQTIDMNAQSLKFSGSVASVNIDSQFVVNAGSSFKVDPGGFGGNIQMSVPVSNALHVGCFPGPGAGPSTPYIGVASPASPATSVTPISPSNFSNSNKKDKVESSVSSLEKGDGVDKPGNPDISSKL